MRKEALRWGVLWVPALLGGLAVPTRSGAYPWGPQGCPAPFFGGSPMFSPGVMSAPPQATYPAPAYAPRRSPMQAAAPAQPKPLIRAQAPEEPKPARPPLLTLPSPEQLGVTVRANENAADWTTLHARMKELGVLGYHIDSLPDGQSRFTCWMPSDRPGLTRRIEVVAATETEAAQRGLQEAARMRP